MQTWLSLSSQAGCVLSATTPEGLSLPLILTIHPPLCVPGGEANTIVRKAGPVMWLLVLALLAPLATAGQQVKWIPRPGAGLGDWQVAAGPPAFQHLQTARYVQERVVALVAPTSIGISK